MAENEAKGSRPDWPPQNEEQREALFKEIPKARNVGVWEKFAVTKEGEEFKVYSVKLNLPGDKTENFEIKSSFGNAEITLDDAGRLACGEVIEKLAVLPDGRRITDIIAQGPIDTTIVNGAKGEFEKNTMSFINLMPRYSEKPENKGELFSVAVKDLKIKGDNKYVSVRTEAKLEDGSTVKLNMAQAAQIYSRGTTFVTTNKGTPDEALFRVRATPIVMLKGQFATIFPKAEQRQTWAQRQAAKQDHTQTPPADPIEAAMRKQQGQQFRTPAPSQTPAADPFAMGGFSDETPNVGAAKPQVPANNPTYRQTPANKPANKPTRSFR